MARAVESINGVPIGEDDLHCEALVLKCITSFVDVMVLRCALKLHIFDAIHRHAGQPVPLTDLAAALPAASVHHPTLRRVMRYLANMRLVNVREAAGDQFYTLTPASSTYLRVDSEKSFVPFARFLIKVEMIEPFLSLDACVVAGDMDSDVPAIERLGGKCFYDMVALDPEAFHVTMRAMVRRTAEAVVEGSPAVFEGLTTVVDVGGGDGMMAETIARAFPGIKCVVLELAHVVERAPERVGVEFVAGDMFVSLPRADALLFTKQRKMARGTESINGVSVGEDDLRCEALVHKHMNSAVDAMVLRCALKLQIFDAIHRHAGRQVSVPDLAAAMPAASVHHSTLRRVLRYLANMHLLAVDGGEAGEVYTLTPASSIYLRADSEKSLAAFVMLLTEAEMLAPFSALEACVAGKNGPDVPAIEQVGGKSFYAMAAMDPAKGKVFDGAMKVMVRRTSEAVVKGCPAVFEGVGTLVDVGGGEGIMAAAIARAFPTMKCVVLEQAHVVERAPEIEKVEFVAGDMFFSLPRADALLFTRVLHNWSDEKAAEILKQCKKAMDGDKGKVIIVDVVIGDSADDEDVHQVKLIRDIIMMAHYGGKQRTKEEWRSLLSEVGFKNSTFTRLEAFEHVIEARP